MLSDMPAQDEQKCRQLAAECKHPGYGIRDQQTLGRMELWDLENGVDPDHPQHTGSHYGNNHRQHR